LDDDTLPLRALDRAFARFLHALDPQAPPSLLLAAAVLAHREGQGHSCLPLAELFDPHMTWQADGLMPLVQAITAGHDEHTLRVLWPASPLLAGDSSPLQLQGARLYLRRYAQYEANVAAQVLQRVAPAPDEAVATADAREWLDRLFPPRSDGTVDWQREACAQALRGQLTVITGGPGTGKTYTAARLLVNVSQNAPRQQIVADAAKLLDGQRDNSSWGWFKDSETSSPIVSAYAVWALNSAWRVVGDDLGHKDQLNRATQYLQSQLGDANTFLNRVAADESAFYTFVLSEANVPVSGYLDQLSKNKDKLGSFGKALLAMALQNVNKTDSRISGLLADVNSAVTQSATGATWSSANGGLQRWAFTAFFCTDTRATAIILYALARLDAKNPMLPNVARWLAAARSGSTWVGAQDSLWGILALDAYADATSDRAANYDWRVSLNDAQVMAGKAAPGDATFNKAVITATQLLSGTNAITFERGDGAGRLYYTAQLKVYLPAGDVKALDRGISISRVYELADCVPEPGKPCEALASAPVGKNVRVRLTVVAPTALYFVKVSDPFAAGMEPVELPSGRGDPIPLMKFWPWFFSHTQLYDDRAEIYADYLPAGTHEFEYTMHASLAGSFNVMPAFVTQAYFPETFGRSDGQKFVVTK
jgi:uncharacterized protein YfaS (alpha-2-macroglobulin family)